MSNAAERDISIRVAETDADIAACFGVMQQLRLQLQPTGFVAQVRRQMAQGYRLAKLQQGEEVIAVAGYRVTENLFLGRFLYVDDLITDIRHRSRGYGKRMLDWLVDNARREQCTHVELDSGLQRKDAHRFYLREGMTIRSHHFSRPLAGC